MSTGHGHLDASNKRIALLIAVLALFLALSETLGKNAQTGALSHNVDASNLWAFFQAKSIRQTVVRTAAEGMEVGRTSASPETAATIAATLERWNRNVGRWESEPETQEGRKEIALRAKAAETARDLSLARYHHYELASAAIQIAIVLASAAVVTGIAALIWLTGALGCIGLLFTALGLWAPHSLHLL